MNGKLSLHPDALQVVKLLLEPLWVFELDVGRINRHDAIGVAAHGEVLPRKVQLFVTFTPVHFKVCREIICAESCSNESITACL